MFTKLRSIFNRRDAAYSMWADKEFLHPKGLMILSCSGTYRDTKTVGHVTTGVR